MCYMHLKCPQKPEVGKNPIIALMESLVAQTIVTKDALTVSPGCRMSCPRAQIISGDLSVI